VNDTEPLRFRFFAAAESLDPVDSSSRFPESNLVVFAVSLRMLGSTRRSGFGVDSFNSSSDTGMSKTSMSRGALKGAFTGNALFFAELPFAIFVDFDAVGAGAFA
jgi:hypothetical protein